MVSVNCYKGGQSNPAMSESTVDSADRLTQIMLLFPPTRRWHNT